MSQWLGGRSVELTVEEDAKKKEEKRQKKRIEAEIYQMLGERGGLVAVSA